MSHQKALAYIRREGAELFDDAAGYAAFSVTVYAPPGREWHATGTHNMVGFDYDSRRRGWESLWEDLQLGHVPCDHEGPCET